MLNKAELKFQNLELTNYEIHKLRGYVGNIFNEYDLIHNHNPKTDKLFYRYPLIQFKLMNKCPVIVAFTDKAINILKKIFNKLDQIEIEGKTISILKKNLETSSSEFGQTNKIISYEFHSSWIALNQKNYRKFLTLVYEKEKQDFLNYILVGNVLSMCRGLDYMVTKKINAETRLIPCKINLKGKTMIGFLGTFQINFHLPNLIGLGKSVSRGYGTVIRRIN